jgi:hypothetical protein
MTASVQDALNNSILRSIRKIVALVMRRCADSPWVTDSDGEMIVNDLIAQSTLSSSKRYLNY